VTSLTCSHYKAFDDFLNPLIAFTFPLPKVALYPLLLLVFGIDSWSKIALISIGLFYLLHIHFRIGFLRVLSSSYSEIINIYPLRRWDYLWNFLLKGTLQELFTGLQVALNYGLTLVVVSEFSASNNGIGYFIWKSWDQFKIINVYSGVVLLSCLGFLLFTFFTFLIDSDRKKY
jgi:NitT/TauT family transport system permease protein